jgi:peptidoglycan/xylan/chitin deacetylase (PgdA/CDA1 family)
MVVAATLAGLATAVAPLPAGAVDPEPEMVVQDGRAGGPADQAAVVPPPDLVLLPPAGTVSLTFDDGPHPTHTEEILDILDAHDAVATFFVTGERVDQYPDLVAEIVARGHSVQNHGYSHLQLTSLTDAAVRQEIGDTTDAMVAAGTPSPRCLRPPYGAFDERIRALARDEGGLELRTWHIDSEDWTLPGASVIRQRVADVESGQIVLLHDGLDGSGQTVDALPGILDDLDERGLSTEPICQSWADFGFFDVRRHHAFHEEISWLADSGITGGYDDNTFRPAAVVSRQAMAAFLHRMMGTPPVPPSAPTFVDVPASSPFYDAVRWLASEGVTSGFPDGTFGATTAVSRQAMAGFLWRLAGEPPPPGDAPTFPDVSLANPFRAAIRWLASESITGGFPDGTFRPTAPVTRQGMAAFLQRYDDVPTS